MHATQVIRRPETPPARPVRRRRRRTGLIAGIVVGVLAVLALGAGWYLGSGRYTTAPPVLGLTQQVATAKLQGAGLLVKVEPRKEFSETVANGLVLRQNPEPNGRVRKDGTVTLVLSRGPDRRAVPTLVGSTQEAAAQLLKTAGLRVGEVKQEFSRSSRGTVIRTDPAAGQRLRPGTAVALVVSKGIEQLPVPDVQGKPQKEAEAALRKAGFVPSSTLVFSETVDKGVVIDQSPSAGTAGRGSTVTLQVSKGPNLIEVPDVRGKSREDAEDELKALGLRTRVIKFPGAKTVRTQSPAPGTMVEKGSVVTLGVY